MSEWWIVLWWVEMIRNPWTLRAIEASLGWSYDQPDIISISTWFCSLYRDIIPCPHSWVNNILTIIQAMKSESPLKGAAPFAAMMPFLAPLATYAAEGTGRVCSTPSPLLCSCPLRPSALTTQDFSLPLTFLWSSSSLCIWTGQANRRGTTSSMDMRRDATGKPSNMASLQC